MLLRTPGASFFHSSAWARVLSESYGYTPLYFTVIENGKLRALVPVMEVNSILTGKRGVSLPFTDYCEPIINEAGEFDDLFNSVVEYGKKQRWKYIELRGGAKYLRSLEPRTSNLAPGPSSFSVQPSAFSPQPSEAPGPSLEPQTLNLEPVPKIPRASCPAPVFITYVRNTLDLTKGEGEVFGSLRGSVRRNIKRAKARRVDIKISNESEATKEFYRLHCITRKQHGLPPQPFHFFQKIHTNIILKGLGLVALAFHNDHCIAGALFFSFGDKAIFKYGASEKKYQNLRANNLVMWEGIKWFLNHGHKSLCFGRTQLENAGLRRFKNGWGTGENSLRYFKYDLGKMAFTAKQTRFSIVSTRLFHWMPLPILKLAGSVLYRHIG